MDENNYPRVLVVSHNVFSRTVNVGRFLADTFGKWPADRIAQLFFYEETPTTLVCKRYYQITDRDILHSVIHRGDNCGRKMGEKDIDTKREHSISKELKSTKIYKFKSKHAALARVLREIAWGIGTWKSNTLSAWIEEFNPEIIYYVMSDYCFPTNIVSYIASKYQIPIFTSIEDDYYFYDHKSYLLDKLYRNKYKRITKSILEKSAGLSYASEIMLRQYEGIFKKGGFVQYKSAKIETNVIQGEHKQFFYAGSLSFSRWKTLLAIGEKLKGRDASLVIYSNANDSEILNELSLCEKIDFRGFAPSETIEEEINKSAVLLVVESFDKECVDRVKCSLSTKIADYLGRGKCILACGPKNVGSIDYLYKYRAALVSDLSMLNETMDLIFEKSREIKTYIDNATELARRNHDENAINSLLYRELKKCVSDTSNR